MALKAGRVGVAPDEVNARGKIKNAGLTPEQSAKLERALLTPVTAPLENELVGLGTGNDQIRITLGDGLELEGTTSPYTLKAAAAGLNYLEIPVGMQTVAADAKGQIDVDLSEVTGYDFSKVLMTIFERNAGSNGNVLTSVLSRNNPANIVNIYYHNISSGNVSLQGKLVIIMK